MLVPQAVASLAAPQWPQCCPLLVASARSLNLKKALWFFWFLFFSIVRETWGIGLCPQSWDACNPLKVPALFHLHLQHLAPAPCCANPGRHRAGLQWLRSYHPNGLWLWPQPSSRHCGNLQGVPGVGAPSVSQRSTLRGKKQSNSVFAFSNCFNCLDLPLKHFILHRG